jgi:hypothetical protein
MPDLLPTDPDVPALVHGQPHTSFAGNVNDDDDLDCADLENAFPGWHAWVGAGGDLYYARRLLSSPPVVFRSATIWELRDLIAEHLKNRA